MVLSKCINDNIISARSAPEDDTFHFLPEDSHTCQFVNYTSTPLWENLRVNGFQFQSRASGINNMHRHVIVWPCWEHFRIEIIVFSKCNFTQLITEWTIDELKQKTKNRIFLQKIFLTFKFATKCRTSLKSVRQ